IRALHGSGGILRANVHHGLALVIAKRVVCQLHSITDCPPAVINCILVECQTDEATCGYTFLDLQSGSIWPLRRSQVGCEDRLGWGTDVSIRVKRSDTIPVPSFRRVVIQALPGRIAQ